MHPSDDPYVTIAAWLKHAEEHELNDPNAMTLATSTKDGIPSARMVLLKGFDANGFVFFTNLGSRKASELQENPRCALLLHWKSSRRQVRVEGDVTRVADDEADAYFATRARDSQVGAWASRQSEPMTGRAELEQRIAHTVARFGLSTIPRPPFWSGFRVAPRAIELWEDRPFRLHMRYRYERDGDGWKHAELFP
jgi:pyridoxamine 5'-phosphate oxidase